MGAMGSKMLDYYSWRPQFVFLLVQSRQMYPLPLAGAFHRHATPPKRAKLHLKIKIKLRNNRGLKKKLEKNEIKK
jgi:hypothetical protein